jgi:hypothetical protein
MKKLSAFAFIPLLCAASGCSVLIDDGTAQCSTDTDCLRFGGNPYCRNHVCVPSGLGPEGCVTTEPIDQNDYLNACSTASCVPFDNCKRLGLCGASATEPAPVDPTNATIPPLVNPVSTPTVRCADAGPNVIYMYGTSDFAPLLRGVQPLLSAGNPPYRGVYLNASSCSGVTSVFDPNKRVITNPAPTAAQTFAFYFDDNGNQVNCLLADTGNTVDVGVSDLFSTTCNTDTASYVSGTTVSDYTGPVVPFVMSVPASSSESAISAEAAHMVFGRGGRGDGMGDLDASPWIDPTYYFIRNGSAGSTVLTALLIDVPKTKFWGVDRLSTDNLRDSMLASTATSQSIGILSIDYADKNRGNLRSLYLQAEGQRCGYQPDSTPNSFDKLNVRDGHYPLWGYVHFFAPVGPGGVPSNAAKAIVTHFSVARLDQALIDSIIAASEVPQCAMKVVRTGEVGDYGPQKGLRCGCYFDAKTTGSTTCAACASASDCPSDHPACNYGYCEVN